MEFTVSSADDFSFGAATEQDRIRQNCANLLGILWGEVMGDRTLGIDPGLIDRPVELVRSELAAGIIELISEREPRAEVTDIQFDVLNAEGDTEIKVVIGIA